MRSVSNWRRSPEISSGEGARVADPGQRAAKGHIGQSRRVRQAGERPADGMGEREADDSTAIGRSADAALADAGNRRDRLEGEPAAWMVGPPVVVEVPARCLGVEDHRRVLARAVMTQLVRWPRLAPTAGLSRRRTGVRSALQSVPGESAGAQRGLDQAHVAVFSGVRGSHHRQHLDRIGEVVRVEVPGRDERRSWNGLADERRNATSSGSPR